MSMNFKLITSLTVAFAAFAGSMHAQPVKVSTKFGKVSKDEVAMTVYEPDTSAAAVVLLDVGKTAVAFDPNGYICLRTHHHERIKILKEEGVRKVDYEMIYYGSGNTPDNINGVRVVTYNMNGGEIVKTRMTSDCLFDEEYVDSYRKRSFTPLDVRVGSVIEVEYDLISYQFLDFDKTYFQRDIPVNMFEYEVHIPDFAKSKRKVTGYYPVNNRSETLEEYYSIGTVSGTILTNVDYYSGQNLPAMKKEPYLYSTQQYMSAVDYDISSIEMPGRLPQFFSVDWDDIDKRYYDGPVVRRLKDKSPFPDAVAGIAGSDRNDVAKIAAIRDLVRSEINWNGNYRLIPAKSSKVLKEKSGSNADINAIIGACLREAGYTVEPVLIKRRSSGVLIQGLTEMHPYDTFILRVATAQGGVYYLDGGSEYTYLNVLPADLLVTSARLLRAPGQSQWVDLSALTKNSSLWVVNAKLDANGTLTGELNVRYTGQESCSFKSAVHKAGSQDEYIENLENSCSVEVNGSEFQNFDKWSGNCMVKFNFTRDADRSGGHIYVNPFICRFHDDTDFSAPERICPVEFPYKTVLTYVFNLELPENYSVTALPESGDLVFKELNTACRVQYSVRDGALQLVYNFIMGDVLLPAAGYAQLREFWQQLCGIYNGTVVISEQ